MAGRLLPKLPLGRKGPWVLGASGAALLVYGLIDGNGATMIAGGAGLGGVVVAFPLAALILRSSSNRDS